MTDPFDRSLRRARAEQGVGAAALQLAGDDEALDLARALPDPLDALVSI